jgi:hypothetical protein|nr:MAG TPA: hypothetical protein [Caudoviricetes sp.]
MSNLENLVPPLELCKRIPAGEFEDSALVWVYDDVVEFLCRTSGCEQIHKKEWQLDHNHPRKIAIRRKYGQEIYPAPTLEEILEEIGKIETWDKMTIARITNGKQSLTTNALKRWFEVKGINLE